MNYNVLKKLFILCEYQLPNKLVAQSLCLCLLKSFKQKKQW